MVLPGLNVPAGEGEVRSLFLSVAAFVFAGFASLREVDFTLAKTPRAKLARISHHDDEPSLDL